MDLQTKLAELNAARAELARLRKVAEQTRSADAAKTLHEQHYEVFRLESEYAVARGL